MKLIVANLKMYLDGTTLKQYIEQAKKLDENVVICPSSIHIPYFLNNNYKVGIQNIAPENKPSQTGEVSALQAKNLGVSHVIIGHSERRTKFYETNDLINKKIKEALSHNLKVILCIGETIDEHENNQTKKVLKKQLEEALKDINNEIIIAYEPVYAIGTGNVPTNEIIEDNIIFIKNEVVRLINIVPKVLYGGSINNENISELEKINSLDGYLIGSASTKIEVLNNIYEKTNRQNATK